MTSCRPFGGTPPHASRSKLLVLILLVVSIVIVYRPEKLKPTSGGKTASTDAVRAEMGELTEAVAKARETIGHFLSIVESEPSDDIWDIAVKVGIKDGEHTEYFWLTDVTYNNGVFSGSIDVDPESINTVARGQEIRVKKDEIFDWYYMDRRKGKMVGNYTGRVLLRKLPKAKAEELRKRWGWEAE